MNEREVSTTKTAKAHERIINELEVQEVKGILNYGRLQLFGEK